MGDDLDQIVHLLAKHLRSALTMSVLHLICVASISKPEGFRGDLIKSRSNFTPCELL